MCTYVEVGVVIVLEVVGASDVLVDVVVGILEDDVVLVEDVLEVVEVVEVELVELVLVVVDVVDVDCEI